MKSLTIIAYLFTFSTVAFAQEKVQIWLNNNATSIKTVDVESGFEDLMPLKETLKEKRIVALGEATHGTKEFFQMKHRMLEFLVKELGFTIFGIEANFSESLVINNYVLYGQGDPVEALRGIYIWPWQTEEVLAMIEWMKKYNQDKPLEKRVKFYGFDMQFSYEAAKVLSTFLLQEDRELYKDYVNTLKVLENKDPVLYKELPDNEKEDIYIAISQLKTQLKTNKDKYLINSEPKEFELLMQHVNTLVQFLELRNGTNKYSKYRDIYMADNAKWILDYEGENSKMVVWAHNGHIQKCLFMKPDEGAMGTYLAETYESQFYSIGFDFNKGSFNAINKGLSSFTVGDARRKSTSYKLSKSDKDLFFFDFKEAGKDPDMNQFLNKFLESRFIGALYQPKKTKDVYKKDNYYRKQKLSNLYDGLIFFNETSSAVPLKKKS